MLSQFQTVGHALFTQGLVSCYSGNLSIKLGEHLLITHRGSMLGSIGEADLVETGITKNDRATPLASTELEVHRSIYKKTSALAVCATARESGGIIDTQVRTGRENRTLCARLGSGISMTGPTLPSRTRRTTRSEPRRPARITPRFSG